MPRRLASGCVFAAALALGLLAAGPGTPASGDPPPPPPNIVLLLSDDQPANDMAPLVKTRELVADQGVTFNSAYVSYPLCCPSRASILTGLYMHNHGVRGNGGTYGGLHRFRDGVGEASSVAVRLHNAGYYTALIGKYLNGYSAANGLWVPPGWDEWYARLGGETKIYYDYTLVEKGPSGIPAPVYYGLNEADYSTDVFASKALDLIERAGS